MGADVKKLNEIYEKYSVIIKLVLMAAPLLYGIYKYLSVYIDVPDRQDAFESRAKSDSVWVMQKFKQLDSADRQHSKWLMDDYDSLKIINAKLKKIE